MAFSAEERAAARLQSFTTKAVAVVVLYFVLWIPGIIANVLFHNEATRAERIAGERLPGTGCLRAMLFLNIALVAKGPIAAAVDLPGCSTDPPSCAATPMPGGGSPPAKAEAGSKLIDADLTIKGTELTWGGLGVTGQEWWGA